MWWYWGDNYHLSVIIYHLILRLPSTCKLQIRKGDTIAGIFNCNISCIQTEPRSSEKTVLFQPEMELHHYSFIEWKCRCPGSGIFPSHELKITNGLLLARLYTCSWYSLLYGNKILNHFAEHQLMRGSILNQVWNQYGWYHLEWCVQLYIPRIWRILDPRERTNRFGTFWFLLRRSKGSCARSPLDICTLDIQVSGILGNRFITA